MFKKFKLTFNFAIKMLGLFSRRSLYHDSLLDFSAMNFLAVESELAICT